MPNKLYEYLAPERANVVIESAGPGKDLCMRGIFIQGEVRNHNQRVYPMREIQKAVSTMEEKIRGGDSILGELDHPEELSINLDRVSHVITEVWMDGNDGYGKLKVLPTPTGNIARALLESGIKLGVSSRGSGNVGHDGAVSDFEIVTVDIVAQPSAPNAYPKTIYESLFNMRGGELLYNTAKAATHDPAAKKHLSQDIVKFIKDLKIR